jgi:hypothetical protein
LGWPLQNALRANDCRPKAEAPHRRTKESLLIERLLYPERFGRPRTRADCKDLPRPCPFVGCQFNLYLDISHRSGAIRWNYDCEPWEMVSSCALDVADEGGVTLEETGQHLGLTRERVRQVEVAALAKLAALDDRPELPSPRRPTIWERMGGA